MNLDSMELQLQLSLEGNETLGNADRIVARKMVTAMVLAELLGGTKPNGLVAVGANVAAEMVDAHMFAEFRVVEGAERAERALWMMLQMRGQFVAPVSSNLRGKRAICALTGLQAMATVAVVAKLLERREGARDTTDKQRRRARRAPEGLHGRHGTRRRAEVRPDCNGDWPR